jgi:predicted transcriptional regulator
MRIDKLCVAIAGLKSKYKLDSTDILLLNAIVSTNKDNGGVTIMDIIRNFKAASYATTQRRIKKLRKHGLIDRVFDETNPGGKSSPTPKHVKRRRVKKLKPTAKYNDLVKYLREI